MESLSFRALWGRVRELLARLEQQPGFEPRPGQRQMAETVVRAIAEGLPAVIEAGTGTGKTFGYLIPALCAEARVLVSTSTKALQEQLVHKDLPLLGGLLDRPVSWALLKGRQNYLCRLKMEAGAQEERPVFETRDEAEAFRRLLEWARRSDTDGDLEQFPGRVTPALRELVTMDADGCGGRQCPFYDTCFLMEARRRAERADVVVVNHALLLQDLMLRARSGGALYLLPEAEVLVIDEAHRLEEMALGALSVYISPYRVERLRRQALRLPGIDHRTRAELEALGLVVDELRRQADSALAGRPAAPLTESLSVVLLNLRDRAGVLGDLVGQTMRMQLQRFGGSTWQEVQARYEAVLRGLQRLAADAGVITERWRAQAAEHVLYVQRERRQPIVICQPLDAGGTLQQVLFEAFPTVVCTSATLTTLARPLRRRAAAGEASDGPFAYFRRRTGFPEEGLELIVPAPFDYRRQALLYLPPDPARLDPTRIRDARTQQAYEEALIGEVQALVAASRGRALVLTTSLRMMERLAEALQECGYPVLVQGSAPRARLVRQLKAQASVLVATRAFWEGVDVPGEALSLVVIDRLPFPGREDPYWQARYEQAGDDWFELEALPQALLTLKQGFGRLIRTRTDRGVVALLDGRLQTKYYGRWILEALPPARRVQRIDEVTRFFC
ncbi:ATP-dependent DNA helicase [Rhodothermus marinus]|uniref:ATP-dependent DNA helicase n=1 Tax=Rhodothermus marinus TaxID=29549 RepID=UPI001E0473E9|nr:ATP-dependent DNA helicase [Rhodothermus marinus]MBO2490618.1 ATP-dependent DNA helicase [Rhodothermus marinus]